MTAHNTAAELPSKKPFTPPAGPGNNDFLEMDAESQAVTVLEDFEAAYRLLESGGLHEYGGQFAAFLGGHLVGTGPDSVDLRSKVGRDQLVHPERVAVIHVRDEAVL